MRRWPTVPLPLTIAAMRSILEPDWNHTQETLVSVNLSIKNVPDDLAARLREAAARNHRSLQGHLMAILEEAAASDQQVTPRRILLRVQELKLRTGAEAAEMVRADRDAR